MLLNLEAAFRSEDRNAPGSRFSGGDVGDDDGEVANEVVRRQPRGHAWVGGQFLDQAAHHLVAFAKRWQVDWGDVRAELAHFAR
jgi:hypothetical protein